MYESVEVLLHDARVQLFLQFVDAGGAAERPDEFDWQAYVMPAVRELLRRSEKDDINLRRSPRRSRSVYDERAWDAWRDPIQLAELSSSARATCDESAFALNMPIDLSADGQTLDAQLSELLPTLSRVLTEREMRWLYQRDVLGLPSSTLADELVALNPSYQDGDGRRRALSVVDVTVSRARRRARKFLGEAWSESAKECACR